jgi:hypothetical protein
MKKYTSSAKWIGGPFKFVGNIIHNIINYLTCDECDTTDNRRLLRNLYNAGYLDEGKYHQFRERCLNEKFDPEEIHESS